jgi:dynein intermediate chain 2
MEIVYVYQKKRRQFGRQPLFGDFPAILNTDIQSDPAYMSNFSVKNPIHTEVQSAPEMSEHEVCLLVLF